ncbi:DUF6119 family protein [Ohtaekwangia koreensis]|uniref:Sporadically distributed protein, TIGR04141 family n=1 Tax=Ohtaekwangia koreensis TaxID=688867 RepID=A0A1T5K6I6_9BACT|nr:DUF6119 family protein [Ohtaekwangia koreensis]SKC59145.1 sporadically distributed protein, TIGR04141 family [Ohtaekwangia koreensis]
MTLDNVKFSLKIFSIDKMYYEFKDKNSDEIIDIIRENHKSGIYANDSNIAIVKPSLQIYQLGSFKFYSYCYNQPKNQNYWKLFLPDELTTNQTFDLLELSFVLFIVYSDNIYSVIGGSGINVIKKFIDPYFGIDFYQHFAKPNDDISIVVNTRGVTGNLSERSNTFNDTQSVNDALDYSEIPKKIKVKLRDELREGIFKKYGLDSELAFMEVGSYFCLKKKIDFEELKQLVIDIHNIRLDKSNYTPLTLFNKVVDQKLVNSLDNYLQEKIADDVVYHNNPSGLYSLNDGIIELVNSKLEKFYECDTYRIKLKRKRKTNDKFIQDRANLYLECTKYIYNNIDDINNRFIIKQKFFELSIIGIIAEKDSTYGTFYSHINAEISYQNSKYFRVDGQWFFLDSKFIERIKLEAINYYKLYKLEIGILKKWELEWDEDEYNKSHINAGYYVFDKVLNENIELCDILHLDGNSIYLIHVKDAFNTTMRNLSSQIILSAKRLWNDINNHSGTNYFIKTINIYNARNPSNKLDAEALFSRIANNEISIKFVMAFNNRVYRNKTSVEKIELSDSNIAKFSLVQTVREMLANKRFAIRIIDISEIN